MFIELAYVTIFQIKIIYVHGRKFQLQINIKSNKKTT